MLVGIAPQGEELKINPRDCFFGRTIIGTLCGGKIYDHRKVESRMNLRTFRFPATEKWHLCVVLQNTSGLLRRYQGYQFLTVSKLVSHSKLKLLTFCYNLTLIIYSPDEEN